VSPSSTSPTAKPSSSATSDPPQIPTKSPSTPTGSPQLVAVNSVIASAPVTISIQGIVDKSYDDAVDCTTNRISIDRNQFESKDLAGIVATPSGRSIVKKIRVYQSNNCKSCDPTTYKIEGRNDESEVWKLVSSGAISISRSRNARSIPIVSTYEQGDMSRKFAEVEFVNDVEYSQYHVTFPTIKDDIYFMLRFAEVELPGYNIV